MKSIEIELQTNTPLFMGGADPRGEPEFRTASLRGALRFWLRALMGGVLGDNDLKSLSAVESLVFGDTDGASPVAIRIRHGSPKTITFSQLAQLDPKTGKYRKPGLAYLFFAARQTGKDKDKEPERRAIVSGSSFNVRLYSKNSGGAVAEEALRRACAALWLLVNLGGTGARARRGGGSLQIKQAGDWPEGLPSRVIKAAAPAELQKELSAGLAQLRKSITVNSPALPGNPSAFDVLHPSACSVWVVDHPFDTAEKALDAIGSTMQNFRSRYPQDYKYVKAAAYGGALASPVPRAGFGLPIVFFYKKDKRSVTLEGEEHERRASPLGIRVSRLANGKYALVLTLFRARLLPGRERLKLKRPGPPAFTATPGLQIIEEFLDSITIDKQIVPLLEVKGW